MSGTCLRLLGALCILPGFFLTAATQLSLPLAFEKNQGQAHSAAGFVARGPGLAMALASDEVAIAAVPGKDRAPTVARMRLLGANAQRQGEPLDPKAAKANYFLGSDPRKWRTGVETYGKVRFRSVYPGIDVVYYGNENQLEYDFEIAPGADLTRIELEFLDLKPSVDGDGDLILRGGPVDLKFKRPIAYQDYDGRRVQREAGYELAGSSGVRFTVPRYDRTRALVIDPVLVFISSIGGESQEIVERGRSITRDASGNLYVTGTTYSSSFPTLGALQPVNAGNSAEVFIAKLSADGTALVYATYLGGSGPDRARAIQLDAAGNIYVAGVTNSTDFPVMNSAQPTSRGAGEGFLAKLNSAGSVLAYSTYWGGNAEDQVAGLAVDPSTGTAAIVGMTQSSNFPTTPGAYQTSHSANTAAFAAKFSAAGAVVYSSLLSGTSGSTSASSVALDSTGALYVAGSTDAPAFPTTPGSLMPTGPGNDGFVAKFNPAGSALSFSTFLGGSSFDGVTAMDLDNLGNVLLTGYTYSSDFPTTPGALDTAAPSGNAKMFVSRLSANGSTLLASTFFGGTAYSSYAESLDIRSEPSGNTVIAGNTSSYDLPLASPLQASKIGVISPLYRSEDSGSTWNPIPPSSSAVPIPFAGSVEFSPANPNRALVLAESAVYRSEDRGLTWSFRGYDSNLGQSKLTPHPSNADIWYSIGYFSGVSKSLDGGATWTTSKSGLPAVPGLKTLAISPADPTVLYAANWTHVFKSTDSGSTWTQVSNKSSIQSLLVSPADPQTIYSYDSQAWKSSNGGVTWSPVLVPACCNGAFSIHPTAAGTLFYSRGGLFHKSADDGANWTSSAIGAGSETPRFIAVNRANPQELFLAFASNGIYRSPDGGVTWAPVNGTTPFRQDPVDHLTVSAGASAALLARFAVLSDGFVARFDPGLTTLLFSSYFGFPGFDSIKSLVPAGTDLYVYGESLAFPPVVGGGYVAPTRGYIDAFVAKISSGNGGCVTSLSPPSSTGHFAGGNAQFRVVTGGGCNWSVTASPPWVSIAPATSGSGIGVIDVHYARNNTGAQRTGTVTIDGQNYTITQAAGPSGTITISGMPSVLGSSAYSSPIAFWVVVSSGSLFSVTSDSAWAVISSGTSINSNSYVGLSVLANPTSTARTATIALKAADGTVVDTVRIYQSGSGCTLSLASSSGAIGASGGVVTVNFQSSPAGCAAWEASSLASWTSAPATNIGTGTAAIQFTVSPNSWAAPRSGVVHVANLSFTVTQSAGSSCSPVGSLAPLTPVSGSLSTSDCLSQVQGGGGSTYYAKQYTVATTYPDEFAVEVTSNSPSLTPRLSLIDPNGVSYSTTQEQYRHGVTRIPNNGFQRAYPGGTYRIEVSSALPNQTGNYSIRLIPGCRTVLPRVGSPVPASGGAVSFMVSPQDTCTWTHTNYHSGFLTVTSPLTRTGSGSVTVQVAANPQAEERIGMLAVGDGLYLVSQAGTGPATPFSPPFVRIGPEATFGRTAMTVPSSTFILSWPTVPWISASFYREVGQVSYDVSVNLGPERTGRILLGNDVLTVSQASSVSDKIGVYANGAWATDLNGNGTLDLGTGEYVEFGNSLYSPVLGDWGVDPRTGKAIFYNGLWYVDLNQNGRWEGPLLDLAAGLGGAGWTPISGDWDGDGTVNIGVYNNGSWYLDWNGDMKWEAGVDKVYTFGGGSAAPIVGDWNLDGKTEVGAYINGLWYLDYDGDGAYVPANDKQVGFGVAGFLPVIGDWNGDGRSKIGIVRNGEWYVDYNGNFQWDGTSVDRGVYLGTTGWLPVIGDWNGDGRKKIGIFKDGQWILDYNGNYLLDGPDKNYMFGAAGQKPIVGKW